MSTDRHPYAGARKAAPTKRHRPAIWECLLGTVYARNPQGQTRYFDYDYPAARAFAGVDTPGADPRLHRAPAGHSSNDGPVKGRLTLWILR